MNAPSSIDVTPVQDGYTRLSRAVARTVVGQSQAIRLAFITLLCSSHSLIEGVPGVAKTLLARSLAAALQLRFGRVQFTPDLMPSDIIGTPIIDPSQGEVRFRPGPLFTDLLLADEINRASAKTQAALLEAMQEAAATVDGERHPLGEHFSVFATQNPVEQEGTYPLPEAELDRFLFKIVVDYPSEEEERAVLALHHRADHQADSIEPVIEREQLVEMRRIANEVIVSEEIVAYAAALARATREDVQLLLGASPRAAVMLLRAAKANAGLEGRDFVLPEDIQAVYLPAFRHRVRLEPGAEVEGVTVDTALGLTLQSVTAPR